MNAEVVHATTWEQLKRRMAVLGVEESDLDETFVRSGGHGGQNVNKLATCVVLLHKPTGLQVKCQTARRQGINRFLARRILLGKLEDRRRQSQAEARAAVARARRQKRVRSQGAKERMLVDKARHATKKSLRRRVEPD
jgi:protein subunit release factor B